MNTQVQLLPTRRSKLCKSSCCRLGLKFARVDVYAAQLAWSTDVDVEIQAGNSDGQKMVVAKEGSDLHVICETPADGASVEWYYNTHTELTSGKDRIEMTARNVTVTNGHLKTQHTLIIRNTSTMDNGEYECTYGSASDQVQVKIVRRASKSLLIQLMVDTDSSVCKC